MSGRKLNQKKSLFAFLILLFFIIPADQVVSSPPGFKNKSPVLHNVNQGFPGNKIENGAKGATIGGGGQPSFPNKVKADLGTIGGGMDNQAGDSSTVGDGVANDASGFRSAIGGGGYNTALIDSSTVAGGYGNTAGGKYAAVCGGISNSAMEWNTFVGGGSGNQALGRHSAVLAGGDNITNGYASIIGGGFYNVTNEAYAAIGGGIANKAQGREVSILGGAGNQAAGDASTIAGGLSNKITDSYNTIGGGRANQAGNANENQLDAAYATVGGGNSNQAGGAYATVPGGESNVAGGAYSFAAGRRATVQKNHDGCFLFADSNNSEFSSTATNEFAVRATGGFRLVTQVDPSGNPLMGVRLAAGSGSWEIYCDQNAKKNIIPIDRRDILGRLMKLPLSSWNYKTQPGSIRHIGPMAQDFHGLFGMGSDDSHITSIDLDGIALASIQGLYETLQEKEAVISAQQKRLQDLETRFASLQERLMRMESRITAFEKVAN